MGITLSIYSMLYSIDLSTKRKYYIFPHKLKPNAFIMASTFIILDADLIKADEHNDFKIITPLVEKIEEVTYLWNSGIVGSFESSDIAYHYRDLLIKNRRLYFLRNNRLQDPIFIKTGNHGELYTQFPEYSDSSTYEILITTRETRKNLQIIKKNGISMTGIIGVQKDETTNEWDYDHAIDQLDIIKKKLQTTNPGM